MREKPQSGDRVKARRQLGDAGAAVGQAMTLTPQQERDVLRARAKVLAREPQPPPPDGLRVDIVEFQVAQERYGIELGGVREVYPLRDLTPIPGTPPYVLGVISVRGEILSVIDLRRFFDLPQGGLTDLNRVIIVRSREMELGILADAVLGIRTIFRREIQPALPTLTGIRAEYLMGVTGDRLVILNTERMLSDRRLIVHEEV